MPDVVVYDGGDITLLICEGKKVENVFLKYGTIPDPSSMDNSGLNIVQPSSRSN